MWVVWTREEKYVGGVDKRGEICGWHGQEKYVGGVDKRGEIQ
jgi:hypothetical protein